MGYQKMDKKDQERVKGYFRDIARENDTSPQALSLVRFVKDRKTKEVKEEVFYLYMSDVACLYKSDGKVFIVTKKGIMNEVPYPLELLQECFRL